MAEFLIVKYCSRIHPIKKKKNNKDSHYWKNLLDIRDQREKHIFWRCNEGNIILWWDNWLGIGALANTVQLEPHDMRKIKHVRIGTSLQFEELQQLAEYLIEIIQCFKLGDPNFPDKAVWTPSSTGSSLPHQRGRL